MFIFKLKYKINGRSKSHSRYKKLLILRYFKTDKIRSSLSWNIKSMVDSKSYSRYVYDMLILCYFKTDKIRLSLSWNIKSTVDQNLILGIKICWFWDISKLIKSSLSWNIKSMVDQNLILGIKICWSGVFQAEI